VGPKGLAPDLRIIAQMQDYAANSIEYLSLERMLAAFDKTCESNVMKSKTPVAAALLISANLWRPGRSCFAVPK
jgi:hypothetical protein